MIIVAGEKLIRMTKIFQVAVQVRKAIEIHRICTGCNKSNFGLFTLRFEPQSQYSIFYTEHHESNSKQRLSGLSGDRASASGTSSSGRLASAAASFSTCSAWMAAYTSWRVLCPLGMVTSLSRSRTIPSLSLWLANERSV